MNDYADNQAVSYEFEDDVAERPGNYVSRHWRGELSLPISYWVNGVLIGGIVPYLAVATATAIDRTVGSVQLSAAVLLVLLIGTTMLSIWIMVGIWRSADNYELGGGSGFWTHAAKFMMFLGGLRLIAQLFSLGTFTVETAQLALGRDTMGAPAAVSVSGDTMTLKGVLAMGTAKKVIRAFEAHPTVRRLVLDSIGGRLGEARSIADLVQKHALNTVARGECSSACTMILLSGVSRSLLSNTRVGFHSPSYPGIDPDDLDNAASLMGESYRRAHVPESFIARAFATSSDSMWYPLEREMFDAGVLNSIDPQRVISDNQLEAQQMKAKLPLRVDAFTTLYAVEPDGANMIYRYRVTVPANSVVSPDAAEKLRGQVAADLCRQEIFARLAAAGARRTYIYANQSGTTVAQFTINRC